MQAPVRSSRTRRPLSAIAFSATDDCCANDAPLFEWAALSSASRSPPAPAVSVSAAMPWEGGGRRCVFAVVDTIASKSTASASSLSTPNSKPSADAKAGEEDEERRSADAAAASGEAV